MAMRTSTTSTISANQHIRELRDELSAINLDTDTLLSSVAKGWPAKSELAKQWGL